MQVLVVDPNIAFATLLTEALTQEGHAVAMCATGAEALVAARHAAPQLAVLDMALEDPDALSLAISLRAMHPAVRLMLIPLMGEEAVDTGSALPIQGVLPKPFFLPELPERIAAALRAPIDGAAADSHVADAPSPDDALVDDAADAGEGHPHREAQEGGRAAAAPALSLIPEAPERNGAQGERRFSVEAFRGKRAEVERAMLELALEVGADAVLLTLDEALLSWVGELAADEAKSIANAVIHGWRTSAEVARILGREQVRFEQSLAGGNTMLYALSVDASAILSVAVRGTAPLGMLRHQARVTAEGIAALCVLTEG